MLEIGLIILITFITAIISLAGGFLLLSHSKSANFIQKYGSGIAAAIILITVFGDIIPEILEDGTLPVYQVAWEIALGTLVCFAISFVAGRFHRHGDKSKLKNKKQAMMMLVIDSLHTILDGIVIGASFAVNIGTGIAAATATAAHEIPQEIGDFAIMLRSNMKKKYIIKLQVLSALILIPSAIIAYLVGGAIKGILPSALAYVAGFLLYIALSEIFGIIGVLWKRIKKSLM